MTKFSEHMESRLAGKGTSAQRMPTVGSLVAQGDAQPLVKPPLRVVHVGPSMLRGGAEQWLVGLIRSLDPRRLQVLRCIVTMPELVDPEVVADMPAPVEVGRAKHRVKKAVRECDVILCWGPAELGEWLADCRPKLCVFVAHGEGDWTRTMLAACAPVVDHVVAVSQRVQETLCAGLPSTNIFNGVDSSRLSRTRSREKVRQSLGFEPGDFVLGYVGRFSPEKRPEVLIDAAAQLPAHFKVLLIGWGPLLGELVQRANVLIPGRYAFRTVSDHLGDYYQAMDAFCLTSDEEGFALVVLEAMMCERPVIATPVGSVPEVIIDRVNGIVIPAGAASLCEAARLLADHPAWARGIAAEGRVFAEEHGHAHRMAREYEDLLERLWLEKWGALPQPPVTKSSHDGARRPSLRSNDGTL